MGQPKRDLPTPEEVQEMSRKGLRPVVLWVPDTSSPEYKVEALRQSRNVARSADEEDITRFIEETGDFGADE